jgi:hypothetical protein
VVGGHQRGGADRRPRSATGEAHERVHPEDGQGHEQQGADPPGERTVAEDLDSGGHDQLGALGMLGVGI